MATPSPHDRIRRGNVVLSRRVWALLADAGKESGVPIRVTQGSWSGSVSASAGTHNGGGAFDISCRGLSHAQRLVLVNALRKRNALAWVRSPEYGWPRRLAPDHIHGIVADEPGLSRGARQQVQAYLRGQNGLASNGRDPFHRPVRHAFVMPGHDTPAKVPLDLAVRLANLRFGKRNEDVKDLQHALALKEDGVYGPVTDKAVRKHQKKMGLTPDPKNKSFVGPKQARALGLKVITG